MQDLDPLGIIALAPQALQTPQANGPDLTRYFFVCGLIVLVIVGLALGFRRLFADTLKRRAAQRSLRIVDVLPLGGKQRLSVVRCYDRTFVLGIGEKEVSLVAELDGAIGSEKAAAAGSAADDEDFARILETAQSRLSAARPKKPVLEEIVA